MIAFNAKVTCWLMWGGHVLSGFLKRFQYGFHSLFLEKLLCYVLDKRHVSNWLAGSTQGMLVNRSFSNWQQLGILSVDIGPSAVLQSL